MLDGRSLVNHLNEQVGARRQHFVPRNVHSRQRRVRERGFPRSIQGQNTDFIGHFDRQIAKRFQAYQ
jgi:hypothetical protein